MSARLQWDTGCDVGNYYRQPTRSPFWHIPLGYDVGVTAQRGNDLVRRLTPWRKRQPIVVVSGLPRSGTSMAMRMLEAGGMPILTDGVRHADDSNVHGYYELEAVKNLPEGGDTAWLKSAHGKAVKIISFLLTWLPETHDYRVIFMRRGLDEVVASQHAMLASRGEPADSTDADRLRLIYQRHLEEVARLIARRACFSVMDLEYRRVLDQPGEGARRIGAFMGAVLDVDAMAAAVDREQYRGRNDATSSC
jgi:hypothetical protein